MKLTITIEAASADEAVKIARALAAVSKPPAAEANAKPAGPTRTLSEIAGDYKPTPVRKAPVEEEDIPDFLRRMA